MEDPVPCSPLQAVSPFGGLSGAGAADILSGLAAAAVPWRGGMDVDEPDPCEGPTSRKDKSLGLLCDNFLKYFASGGSQVVELEPVAEQLSVGRRRICAPPPRPARSLSTSQGTRRVS